MSVIMDFGPNRLAKVFFGSSPNDIKKTVILTLGIPWLFEKLKRRKFVTKRSRGWWNLSVIGCNKSEATVIAVGSGSSNVIDVVRLLTKFSCRNIVGVGLAGALRRDIQIGDIIVPVCSIQAFAESVREAVSHSNELYSVYKNMLKEFCRRNKISLHEGLLCTIDSITSEDSHFYAHAEKLRCIGVDMETFHLYKEATKAGFKVSSFHVVSDNPLQHKSFLDEIPDSDINRKGRIYKKLPILIRKIASSINEK